MPPDLLERDVELAALAAGWAACRAGSGRLMYIEGQAGIGKTELLRAAVRDAPPDLRLLTARGSALEADHSFGIVRQLLEAAVLADPELLAGPAALARTALDAGAAVAGDGPDSAFPVLHGIYWLLVSMSRTGAVALVVDDAHWADEPSLRLLDYLASRLDGLAVGVAMAARPPLPGPSAGLLTACRDDAGTVLLRPAALTRASVQALILARGDAPPEDAFVDACHEASAGNPFMLRAVLAALEHEGVQPVAEAAPHVREIGPEAVDRALRQRLQALPTAAASVAEAVSVLGQEAELRHIAAVTGLAQETVGRAVDLLVGAGVLESDRPARFVHPVVTQAIYAGLGLAARATLHRRAAAVQLDDGWAPSRVAPHLMATEPAGDPEVVETLVAAAQAALRQGAAEPARRYLERAVEEPPHQKERPRVLGLLGEATWRTGHDLDLACSHLEHAAGLDGDGDGVSLIELAAQIRLYQGDIAGAIALLDLPFANGALDRETTLRLRAHQAGMGVLAPVVGRVHVDRLEQYADVPGQSPAELAVLAELAGSRWLDGSIGEAAALAERALANGLLLVAEGPVSVAFNHCVHILLDADRYDLALPALESGIALASAQGSVLGLGSLICLRSVTGWRRGEVDSAETAALDALALLESGGQEVAGPAQRGYLTLALLERGDLEAAERESARSGIVPELLELTYFGTPFHARARLRLAQGRPLEALETLAELDARDERLGIRHLSTPWRRTAVEACLTVGDRDRAGAFAADLLELTERWDTPSARGLALATAGLADGTDAGLELMQEGVATLGTSPARLDHARALVDLGAALRRSGRRADARPHLTEGLDVAAACGSATLVARARAELTAAGARPRRERSSGPDALTASERRIARLAADGQTNREIAHGLFITVRTVENHLSRVYAKLRIGSRRDLPEKMSGRHS